MMLTEGNVNFIFLASSAKSTSLFLAQYAFGLSPSAVLLLRNLGLDDPWNASYTAALIFEFTTQYVCANINKSYQPELPISTHQLALARESEN
jgi:hypothetical protein